MSAEVSCADGTATVHNVLNSVFLGVKTSTGKMGINMEPSEAYAIARLLESYAKQVEKSRKKITR